MNKEQAPVTPKVTENEELKKDIERQEDAVEESRDESPELPARLDFPNKFFQG